MPGAASSPDSAPNPIGGLPAGSRNAPLSFALHAADAAGRLRLHVRVDERTAGFLALGLALASGRPVPVCTTSGTDVAKLVTTPSFK